MSFLSRVARRRAANQAPDSPAPERSPMGCLIIVFVGAIVSAGALRFMWWAFPDNPPPLLQEEPVMFTFDSPDLAAGTVPFSYIVPTDWAGSTVVTSTYYPNPSTRFAANTFVMVTTKDNYRFVEVSQTPQLNLDALIPGLKPTSRQTVAVANGITGELLTVWNGRVRCKEPSRDGTLPGQCDTTRALVFSTGDITVTIAADGTHPTDGELIAIARSMFPPVVDDTPTP